VSAQLVAACSFEVPVVHRQVTVFPEVPHDVSKRLIRLERKALPAISASICVLFVIHIAPKGLDAPGAQLLPENENYPGYLIDICL
jgi:hypothetical protein